MLIGSYTAILSPKRRIAIPKKFLNQLGLKPILAKWYEGCLVLVARKSWEALLKRLTGEEKIITRAQRDTDRFILASAYELFPDKQGRVIIPEQIASYAGIKNEAVFLGLGDRVEIWDKNAWKTREEYVAKEAAELLERLSKKNG